MRKKKIWKTWKKVYWEDKKEKPARKEYEEKAKNNSNTMQSDVFWHLFHLNMDNSSKKRSTSLGP